MYNIKLLYNVACVFFISYSIKLLNQQLIVLLVASSLFCYFFKVYCKKTYNRCSADEIILPKLYYEPMSYRGTTTCLTEQGNVY